MRTDIWVDFNDIEGSRTCTLLKFAEDPTEIRLGAAVRAVDEGGNSCRAVVADIEGTSVELALDLGTFQPAAKLGLATAQ